MLYEITIDHAILYIIDRAKKETQCLITLALVSYLRSSVVRALHRHRKGVGSIPAGGPIVDEFFSTVPGFFDMCMIPLELKTHLPFKI